MELIRQKEEGRFSSDDYNVVKNVAVLSTVNAGNGQYIIQFHRALYPTNGTVYALK